ncbi:tonB-system energizer ExbB [Ochrobactrum quorumnocens]|jgi:biopolymer transport protein ExbB|uniref:Biopolymer transport protein ExbB n=1 Tax=Ochrobactrum quorumnocens TaxID=271865 RepID=A0A5N1JGD0_9HYPH|nr:tonB-system energizer ExbB [[Ochrobactrum] quorumnocens]KAA9353355.1 tonB-system energizer ExbB [[Ochrobactrum] quorumnocens]MBD7993584.1 tonB-system energizer ExbB [Ochrobactrum gallinarum]
MTGFWRKGFTAAAMGVGLLAFAGSALAQGASEPATNNPAATSPAPTTPAPSTPAASEPTAPAPASPAPANSAPTAEQPATAPSATPSNEPAATQQTAPEVSQPVTTAEAAPTFVLPHDLSPWGMFMAADWVVKSVMIGLALASLATWTVWVAKSLELAGARSRAKRAMKVIGHSATLSEAVRSLDGAKGPAAILVRAAEDEVRLSGPALARAGGEGLKERVSSRLSRIEAKAGRRLSKGTGILATIGSVAPFVGLFGTVWGIMNSFIGISQAQTTNLAVVAPGIAEALLATAIGLVAAIPAVVIYNVFARAITGYRQLLADASAGVERLVSRDLDFKTAGVPEGKLHAAE